MQVYTHEEEDVVMIPMAVNAFFYSIPYGAKNIRYANTVTIGEEYIDILVRDINNGPQGKYYMLDMDSVDYGFRLFERIKEVSKRLIFTNINSVSVQDKLQDNLPQIHFGEDRTAASLNTPFDATVKAICEKDIALTKRICVQIVKGLIEDDYAKNKKIHKLDSSGLYSNKYVNIKNLFLNPKDFYTIAYVLAKQVANSGIEYDGFVSSSKNGAILANTLGMMLDKKAINILGLGPKYAMSIGNLQKEIKKRKNYIYVFDFRCTGTEMKILSALVNAHEAYIQGAVGIAVYKKWEDEDNRINTLALIDIQEENLSYVIAGEEKHVIKILMEK